MIDIAVIILNWNGEKLLEQFIPAVIKYSQNLNTKIFVIDNFSTDDSIEFLKNNYPQIIILKLDKNYGFAGGYNKGLAQIDANYFILINSDIEVTENWINPIIELMNNDHKIAACMPKVKSYRNKEYFEHAGAAGGLIDYYGYPLCRGRLFNIVEKDVKQYEEISEIFWATGACMFIRADLYKKFGGFDQLFFAHMEEIDLCWRFKNAGYKIMYHPQSAVYHVGGATLNYMDPRKTYLNFRNSLFMLYKNLSPEKFYRIFFIRLILDAIAAAKFLIGFEFGNFLAVAKAHFSFYTKIRRYLPVRKALIADMKVKNHQEIVNKSIVYQFFIRKKKYYSEL